MAYSRQASAITGRSTSLSSDTTSPPYYPVEETPERQYKYSDAYVGGVMGQPNLQTGYYGGMTQNDMLAAIEDGYYEGLTEQESLSGYTDQFKIPDDVLTELQSEYTATRPAGDQDISQAIPEGHSDTSGFAPVNSVNELGLAIQEGNIKGAIGHGAKAVSQIATLPAQIPLAILQPITTAINEHVISPLVSKVKGLFSDDPVSSTSAAALASGDVAPSTSAAAAVGSGPGMAPGGTIASGPGIGQPAEMGIPAYGGIGSASNESPAIIGGPFGNLGIGDLADIDIGGFGFGDDEGGMGDDGTSDLGEGFE